MKKKRFIKAYILLLLINTIIETSTISYAKYIYRSKNITAGFAYIDSEIVQSNN